MKRILTSLFCLAIAGLVFQCHVKADPGPPLCYWVTENEAILWRSADDNTPVTATLNLQTSRWTLIPAGHDEAWRQILAGVAQSYPNVDLKQITYEQLWAFALTKLRNEFNSAVAWARPRPPLVEVYLLPSPEQPSPSELKVRFIYDNSGAQALANTTFTMDQTARWRKDRGNVDLEKLLGVPDSPNELSQVFNLSQREPSSDIRERWKNAWDSWIKRFLRDDSSVRQLTYRDAKGQLRWLWRERLAPDAQLPTTYRRMPPAPQHIAELTLPTLAPQTQPQGTPGLALTLILTAIVVAAFLAAYFFGPSSPRALAWMLGKLLGVLEGSKPRDRTISEDILDAIHNSAVERTQERFGAGDPMRALLSASLELARKEYVAAAASRGLLRDEESNRAAIIDEYLQKDLGIAAGNGAKINRWIELGRAVEPSVATIKGLKVPKKVEEQLAPEKAVRSWLDAEWLAEWPRVIAAFGQRVNESEKECDDLLNQISKLEDTHLKDLADVKKARDSYWEAQKSEWETKAKNHQDEHSKAEKQLANSNQKLSDLEKTLAVLEGELRTAGSHLALERSNSSDLQRKIHDLDEVKRLSRNLRRWLQGYSESRINDSRDSRGVAVITALINFSLCQMCFSIIEDLPDVRTAVAHNILLFTKAFSQYEGHRSDFAPTRECLGRIAPRVEDALRELHEAKQLGGETVDKPLFRGLLYWLKTDTSKNLSPFFIDIDPQQKTVAFVNAS